MPTLGARQDERPGAEPQSLKTLGYSRKYVEGFQIQNDADNPGSLGAVKRSVSTGSSLEEGH
jgi:hypothetical protein